MNNKGQITVFLCVVMTIMILIGLTVIEITRINSEEIAFDYASRGAMEEVKAGYHKELFDRYHLLFRELSKENNGETEICGEIRQYIDYTLGEGEHRDITVDDIILNGRVGIMQDELKPFRDEITEYMKLKTELTLIDDLIDMINQGEEASEKAIQYIEDGKLDVCSGESNWNGEDPRNVMTKQTSGGLISLLTADGMAPSKDKIDTTDFPSQNKGLYEDEDVQINLSDIDEMEKQLGISNSDCILKLQQNYYGIAYALDCFDYYTCDKDYNNRLNCEVEYFICGKKSDYDNLSSIVNRIVLHRMPFNLICLMMDNARIAQVEAIAAVLSLIPGVSYSAVKYLLVACWSYAETLVEIKSLLAGNRIPILKTEQNWLTDINKLDELTDMDSINYDGLGGIDYKGFLMIFMAERINKLYYRMADIIQLNLQKNNSDFRFENLTYAWTVEIKARLCPRYLSYINSFKNVNEVDEDVYRYSILLEAGY